MAVMCFEKFQYIMKQILEFQKKSEKIGDFINKELFIDSKGFFSVGDDLIVTLCCMLADEFNCWYQTSTNPSINQLKEAMGLEKDEREEGTRWWDKKVRLWENDIEYWLYEDHKKIEINGKDIPIKTLKQFYKYLVKYCVDKKKN
jgi:hypothetical protein